MPNNIFFDEPHPRALARRTDPETSHRAAAQMSATRTRDRHRVILCHYLHPDGLTDFEMTERITNALGSDRSDQSAPWRKRRSDLTAAGFIEQTPRTRLSPSGSAAVIWRITPLGIGYAETQLLNI